MMGYFQKIAQHAILEKILAVLKKSTLSRHASEK